MYFSSSDIPPAVFIGLYTIAIEVYFSSFNSPPAIAILCYSGILKMYFSSSDVPPTVFILCYSSNIRRDLSISIIIPDTIYRLICQSIRMNIYHFSYCCINSFCHSIDCCLLCNIFATNYTGYCLIYCGYTFVCVNTQICRNRCDCFIYITVICCSIY